MEAEILQGFNDDQETTALVRLWNSGFKKRMRDLQESTDKTCASILKEWKFYNWRIGRILVSVYLFSLSGVIHK